LNDLKSYGWNQYWDEKMKSCGGLLPGRITSVDRGLFTAATPEGEFPAKTSGKYRLLCDSGNALWPVVGDFAALSLQGGQHMIEAVLERKSFLKRKEASSIVGTQAMAANIDIVLIATSLNRDYNTAKLERYLAVAWDSGASPVIALTKSDLCGDIHAVMESIEAVAFGVPVRAVCALTGEGIDELLGCIPRGSTAVCIGSSGVGKSTLLNTLMGAEVMHTSEIREDDARGRHTTTKRQMFVLPGGQIFIDTPGMRELGLADGQDAGLSSAFSDIEDLARQCRFSDCRHESEPGCAVKAAIESGDVPEERLSNWRKLQKELAYLERKTGSYYGKAAIEGRKRQKMMQNYHKVKY